MTNEQAVTKQRGFKYEHVTCLEVSGEWKFSIGNHAVVTVTREDEAEYDRRGGYTGKVNTEYSIEYLDMGRWAFGAVVSFKHGMRSVSPMEDGSQGFDSDYERYPTAIASGDEPGEVLIEPEDRKAPIRISVTNKGIKIADRSVDFPEDVLSQLSDMSRCNLNLERKD